MTTIRFPLYFDSSQHAKVAEWMDTLKHIYSRGIALFRWRQFYSRKHCDNLGDAPQVCVNDFISFVVTRAWTNSLETNRLDIRQPRFKGKRDRINIIALFRSQVKVDCALSSQSTYLANLIFHDSRFSLLRKNLRKFVFRT